MACLNGISRIAIEICHFSERQQQMKLELEHEEAHGLHMMAEHWGYFPTACAKETGEIELCRTSFQKPTDHVQPSELVERQQELEDQPSPHSRQSSTRSMCEVVTDPTTASTMSDLGDLQMPAMAEACSAASDFSPLSARHQEMLPEPDVEGDAESSGLQATAENWSPQSSQTSTQSTEEVAIDPATASTMPEGDVQKPATAETLSAAEVDLLLQITAETVEYCPGACTTEFFRMSTCEAEPSKMSAEKASDIVQPTLHEVVPDATAASTMIVPNKREHRLPRCFSVAGVATVVFASALAVSAMRRKHMLSF